MSIFGLMGAVIDYGRAGDIRVRLQSALDAATLSAAAVNGTLNTTKAQSAFAANFADADATYDTPTFTQNTATGVITGSVTAHVPTNFAGLVGVNSVDVAASSTAYSEFPKVITQATFKTISAKGGFDKEIYFVRLDASGSIISRTKVLDYDNRLGQKPSVIYTPALSSSATITVGTYETYYIEMFVYVDWTYYGVRGTTTTSLKSNAANASSFIKTTGKCDDIGGMVMNWEDGGDSDFKDFVGKMTCVMSSSGAVKVRIVG
jgi:Putative Flp pilus-assembly TadE/G-like